MADNKKEFRSEKIRNILNEPPSTIICYGITIISIVIFVFIALVYFIIRYTTYINILR